MSTLTERIVRLAPPRRQRVAERTKTLIAEEMSLRDLRGARKQTEGRVTQKLPIDQENVSRLVQPTDLLIGSSALGVDDNR